MRTKTLRTIGRDRGHRRDSGKEKNLGSTPGSAIFGNFFSAARACTNGQTAERRSQIAAELLLRPFRNLLQAHGSEFRHHSARLQSQRELGRIRRKKLLRLHADSALQRFPALRASGIACRISAVPPHQEQIWIGGPARLLNPMEGFQSVQELGYPMRFHFLPARTVKRSRGWVNCVQRSPSISTAPALISRSASDRDGANPAPTSIFAT